MAQSSLEERLAKPGTSKIEHEAIFDIVVEITGSSHTISIGEGIEILYDPEKLVENPQEYISTLTKCEESFLYALKDLPEYATRDLNRLRRENRELISTSPNKFIIGFCRVVFKLFAEKSLEEQLYVSQVQYYGDMMHDYTFMQSLFSDGRNMIENYFHANKTQLPPEQREVTANCIIFAKKIMDLYEGLHNLSKLRRNEKERWFYHHFPEERGNFS